MTLSNAQLKFFADYIESQLGIVYVPDNYYQLESRIKNIATYLGLSNDVDVYEKATKEGISGAFKQFLLDIATNNETSFFRDSAMYNALERSIIPELKNYFPNTFSFRIWCCASSFGQEPYSISMLIHEFLQKNPSHPIFEIIGTDIADHALKRCQEATYSQLEVQRGLSAMRLVSYFTKNEKDQWILSPVIKNKVKFQKQNLLEPFLGLGLFHIIFCRYVLIYQDIERKTQIIKRLEKCLVPGGYLILGASESALGISETLQTVNVNGTIFYQRKK